MSQSAQIWYRYQIDVRESDDRVKILIDPLGGHITAPVLKIPISVLGGARDPIFGLETKSTSDNRMVVSNWSYDTTRGPVTCFCNFLSKNIRKKMLFFVKKRNLIPGGVI